MKERFAVRAGGEGRFEIPLSAGSYGIALGRLGEATQTVIVEPNRFTETTVLTAPDPLRAQRPTGWWQPF